MTLNENYDTILLKNSPPANQSSSTTVNENRAEPNNVLANSEVNSSIEAPKDNSNEAINEEEVVCCQLFQITLFLLRNRTLVTLLVQKFTI